MRRIEWGVVRPAWETQVRSEGLVYLDTELPAGGIVKYWREGPYYEFSADKAPAGVRLPCAAFHREHHAELLHRRIVALGGARFQRGKKGRTDLIGQRVILAKGAIDVRH